MLCSATLGRHAFGRQASAAIYCFTDTCAVAHVAAFKLVYDQGFSEFLKIAQQQAGA